MKNIFEHKDNYYKYSNVIEISAIYPSIDVFELPRKFNWKKLKFEGDIFVKRRGSFKYHIWVGSPIGERLVYKHEVGYTAIKGSDEDKTFEPPKVFIDKYNKTILEWDESLNKKK